MRWAAKLSILLVTAAGVSYSDVSNGTWTPFFVLRRTSHTFFTIASTLVDYKYSLRGVALNSDDYRYTLSQVHLRSAKRILKLCQDNKGFYVKAGQFVSSLRQIPSEYAMTLSVLQDQAVPCDISLIKEVICRNLSSEFADIFHLFDEQPLAAASIAQVHRAILKNREEVAVKVQYPGLQQLMELDFTTMSFISKVIAWVFPEYRFGWIVAAFKETISAELDFLQEARNSEQTADNFKNKKNVKIPRVFWDLTTSQILTMQFCPGQKVDDLEFLEKSGIDPRKVGKTLVEVFADMIFIHGFVHGDPHPGNILVSPNVLLDHGMYKKLDEGFRRNYCQLWKALILQNVNETRHIGESFGVGSYAKFLPIIFTGRTINSKAGLFRGISSEERKNVKQELKALAIGDISIFMETLPPDFFTILRTDGMLRSIMSKLGVPQSVRISTYARSALYGLSLPKHYEHGVALDYFISRIKSNLNYLQTKCLIGVLGLLSWIEDIKQMVRKSLKGLLSLPGI